MPIKLGSNNFVPQGISKVYYGNTLIWQSILPAGYTAAEYISASGRQYIVTDIYLNSNSKVTADLYFTGTSGNVYGCYSGSSATDNFCYYGGSNSVKGYLRFDGDLVREFAPSRNTRYLIEHDANGFAVNGSIEATFEDNTFTCSNPFYICNLANSSAAKFTGRIYRLTITEGQTTIADFIPAQNPNSIFGLYDLIGKQFYASETDTEFSGVE